MTIEGYEAFQNQNLDGDFHGAVLTHVDDFEVTGTNNFVEEIIKVVEKELTEYTGLDVNVISDRIEILMEKYAKSL